MFIKSLGDASDHYSQRPVPSTTSSSSLTTPSEASRNVFCPRRKSPPLQLSGCMELWLPLISCPRCPFLFLYGFVCIYSFMRAMVHVRRARWCPSPDTTLYEVLYVAYTTPLTPRVLPRWWIPVGGRVLVWRVHCCHVRFRVCCLRPLDVSALRFVISFSFPGPTGGFQWALHTMEFPLGPISSFP